MAAPKSIVGAPRLAVGPQNSNYVLPTNIGTMPGSTDFGVLGANSGSYGSTGNGSGSEYTDAYGKKFRYVDYGGGRGEWLQVTSSGALAKPQDVAAVEQRDTFTPTQGASIQGTRSAGNVGGTPSNNFFTPAGGTRPVQMGTTGMGVPQGSAMVPQGSTAPNYQQQYNDLLNDNIQSNSNWYTGQKERDDSYLGQLGGIVNGANAADQRALADYNSQMAPIVSGIQGLQAPTWQNYNSNPQDVARQQQSYDWANGVAGGSLDYQAALAGYQSASYQNASQTRADYQTYQAQLADYQRAQLYQAALERYQSNPEDVQGQKDAIAAIKGDLAHGGDDQREAMNRYKALTTPEVTAQERYLAEIARRSFESQDRSNREAQMQDLAMRGMRSGGAEIASALANQERLGQDRTQAELGLQANAVGRSMQALQGYSQSASNLRGADLQSMGLYVDATGQLRAMNDQVGMFNTNQANTVNMFNAGEANQNSQFNANAYNNNQMFNANATNQSRQFNADAYNSNSQFNAGQANNISMFNANAYNSNSQFNAGQYNQTQQFNAGQQNNASANNQSTRLSGGIQAGSMANSIRQNNDVIGMFNTSGSQSSQLAAAQFGLQKGQTLGNIAQQSFGNTTGVNNTTAQRSAGLATSQWQVPSQTEEQMRQLREQQTQQRGILLAQGQLASKRPGTMIIPGMGV